jgi:hypothetical protein
LSSVVDHENSMFQTAENKNSFTQTLISLRLGFRRNFLSVGWRYR